MSSCIRALVPAAARPTDQLNRPTDGLTDSLINELSYEDLPVNAEACPKVHEDRQLKWAISRCNFSSV